MKLSWWKILTIILLMYSCIYGFIVEVPRLDILNETIRNLFFHVPMWFAMMFLLIAGLISSMLYLMKQKNKNDVIAEACVEVGVLFGVLGLITGSIWAKFTWGTWWTADVKLNGAAATMLLYFAYIVLRNSINDENQKARISAVYSVFAFALMIVFIWVMPRLSANDSLHPGNGGNPAFAKYDLTNSMRTVFYPAVIGWTLFAAWIVNIKVRIKLLKEE